MILHHSILWRSIVQNGHEFCQLFSSKASYSLQGIAVFLHDKAPCRLEYSIACDRDWRTQSACIDGWVGRKRIDIRIVTNDQHRWWLNDEDVPEVANSIDLDLNFSPVTNMLPIRRLNLKVGERAELMAAWLKFPDFSLMPLPQEYDRLESFKYRYSSSHGAFVADLQTDGMGFVIDYPGAWIAEDGQYSMGDTGRPENDG